MGGIKSFVKDLVSGSAGDLVEKVGGVVDSFVMTKEEKEAAKQAVQVEVNRHLEALESQLIEREKLIIQDMADARKREIEVANGANVPTINKIITPVLALVVVGLTFALFYMVLFKQLGTEKDIIIYVLGVLSAATTSILSYYFGSSAGSARKQEQLDNYVKKG